MTPLSGWIGKFNEPVLLFSFWVQLLGIVYHQVAEPVLHKYFFFTWISRKCIGKKKQLMTSIEKDLEYYRYFIILNVLKRKLESNIKLFASTSVAKQAAFGPFFIKICLKLTQLDSSKQGRSVLELLLDSVMVCTVNDEAKGSCKGAIELDLLPVFLSAYHIQISVNE